ncbi:hypothetical protein COCCADRAFT_10029 [Bipolaris zeicola 26-R-13]|uniref:Peptidase A1 domain-containing protein n=1 Tax=Cochliobolus carbonum (strain 26-R-13) TaxID=930089 RepID=W6Y8E0_COCC2|nr:uncharacterized protein COCCADRAFT_10029 [Bipolaris zeicola 26-R-13]EUC27366.1 hypothetical protein COCCADRAFT_10029 [Bipolaris zeicola 26-R-13]
MKPDDYITRSAPPLLSTPTPSTPTQGRLKSSTLFWRIIGLITSLILFTMYINNTTMDIEDTEISPSNHSIFIPFIFEFSPQHVPQVMCTVEGVDIHMPVDTGSTGTLIGAPILPNIPSTAGTPAHHFFTSSKILYVGRLVELVMNFTGESGSYATAKVPVLVVDKSWRCPWYDPLVDRFECPTGPQGEQAVERDTSQITYMGIGFGRNSLKDGMPFATPRVNPLLNLCTIDGQSVQRGTMHAGYIVSREGVQVGLTPTAIREFAFTRLEPGLTWAEDSRDWAMASMCFSVNGEGRNCGNVLVDTGIAQMYIRTEKGVSMPTIVIPNPNPNGHAKMVKRVKPGTKITVGFPSLEQPAMTYSFTVGEKSAIEPNYVFPQIPNHLPYINTGRNLLFRYSIAFDAVGGRFGFRSVGNSATASVL